MIKMDAVLPDDDNDHIAKNDSEEMIEQLKHKFGNEPKRSAKVQILTVLPASWSRRKLSNEFETTEYMAAVAKHLAEEKGVLASPNPKPVKSLPQSVCETVQNFFSTDDISREMSGMKDKISYKEHGIKITAQKRLILSTLKEAYCKFKEEYPNCQVGFSKFASLRPKNIVLPGSSGTYNICVCTIHQHLNNDGRCQNVNKRQF